MQVLVGFLSSPGNEYGIQCEGQTPPGRSGTAIMLLMLLHHVLIKHTHELKINFIYGMGGELACHTFIKWLDQEDLEVFLWAKEKKDLMVLTAIMVTTTIRKNTIKRRTSELNIYCLYA